MRSLRTISMFVTVIIIIIIIIIIICWVRKAPGPGPISWRIVSIRVALDLQVLSLPERISVLVLRAPDEGE